MLIHAIIAVIHPEQYRYMQSLLQVVAQLNTDTELHSQVWPFPYTTTQIITNRKTPYHRDQSSPSTFHDILMTLGTYGDQAMFDMRNLGISVPYPPGSIVSIISRLVVHGVPRVLPDRICYAFFITKALCRKFNIPLPGFPTIVKCILQSCN